MRANAGASVLIRPFMRLILGAAALACAVPQAARAEGVLTLRDRLIFASSSTAGRVTDLLAGAFAERWGTEAKPDIRYVGSNQALGLFCGGVGPETPDIAVSTRRMPSGMKHSCRVNGVRDVVELKLGFGAVVLVARRGDPMPQLSSRNVQEALAAERAMSDGSFQPNPDTNWTQIARGLPPTPIRVLVPRGDSGTRQLFEDLVLEAGCRDIKEMRLLFDAGFRRNKCTTLRTDGRVVEVAEDQTVATLMASPPGTLAVVTFDEAMRSGGNLIALPLDGVLPTIASIAAMDYDPTRVVYLYAKRQHARNQQGVGVVHGIAELLAEAASESATGPAGFLSRAGLVPLPPSERIAQRSVAERMTKMSLN